MGLANKITKSVEEKIDYKIYRKFLTDVDIDGVVLKSLNVSRTDDSYDPNVSISIKYAANEYKNQNDKLEVLCRFDVKAITEIDNFEKKVKKKLFGIKFDFCIQYSISSLNTFSHEYIEFFIYKNVPINIWPYARELVSSVTTRMGYQPLVLKPHKSV